MIFYIFQVFNKTDNVLTSIEEWPELKNISFFKSKLNFQIQHSLFREKVSLISLWKALYIILQSIQF